MQKVIRIYTRDNDKVGQIASTLFTYLLNYFSNMSKERDVILGNDYVILYDSKFKIHIGQYHGDVERDKYADVVVLSGWTPSKHEYENVLFNIVLGKNGNIISYNRFNELLSNGYMIDYLSKCGDDVD